MAVAFARAAGHGGWWRARRFLSIARSADAPMGAVRSVCETCCRSRRTVMSAELNIQITQYKPQTVNTAATTRDTQYIERSGGAVLGDFPRNPYPGAWSNTVLDRS